MTCIRLLSSKRRIQLKEMLYTKELAPRMRSHPRQSARNSINTGDQSSFWPTFSELQKHTCAHCSLPVCVQVWRRYVVAAGATSIFQFWLGLSLGYGLEYLISSCYYFLVRYPWREVCHLCLAIKSRVCF
jgi:Fe-S-cluster-containing dehydrogenase component